MRSAKAMGVDGIIVTPGTVDAYSPKVVRSAMGVHFALPVVNLTWSEINLLYPKLKSEITFITTVVEGGESILKLEMKFPLALVVGGEANGVCADALQRSDLNVAIPMRGNTESLNAGVAGSIALYEIMRQMSN
jgi:TrmH family RNA methyltransferase